MMKEKIEGVFTMYFTDYHHHTDNSFDSIAQMSAVCEQAIIKGIDEICFTEHFSVNSLAPTYGHMDFERYFSQLKENRQRYADKLVIKAGIELCEPHLMQDEYKKALANLPLDFVMGSVHNVKEEKLSRYMLNKSPQEIYQGYFDEVYQLVTHADIDVLAHLDLIKRYATETAGAYDFSDYQMILEKILLKAIERGIGIEINTSGLANSKIKETLPSMEVLKLYRSLGGKILTVGSDSHRAETVGYGIEIALRMAKEAGFNSIYTFEKRVPTAVEIDL
ncbi:MAG: histidinol-phosphatase HisJ family protein [Carnobacterium sp.]|uniref:histidinol-phosphatase HisJ family protein n=1 Tax=Carnobacterium sp. TaxID=48221 RepID=UPI002FCA9BC7